ncbi:methyltransferase, partial [Angustibacter peucedani]
RLGLAAARAAHLVEATGEGRDDDVRALVDVRPYAADDAGWWLASDLGELATGGPLAPDHVLGAGGASTTLAQWTPRTPVGRVLDLGTGCGVQAFHAARHATSVLGTDVSARALAFAAFNAALNAAADGGPFAGRTLELRRGDLLEPVAGERFDLVVSNPPFVITPRVAGVPRYEYRDGGRAGDDVVRQLVGGLGDHLAPGGVAQLLGNWEHVDGEWRERVGAWLPPDVQAWVVQREVQDPAEYAETWARDGGHLPGTPAHEALVAGWLDDFAARGVEAVGFGVVTLRRPASTVGTTTHRLDDVRGPLDGPRGEVVTAVLDAEDWLARTTDDDLLAAHLVVAPDVTEERHGTPGADDPQVVLLRQGGGLGRAVRASTALAGLVGASDGELSVGQVVGALAHLLERPEADVRGELLPDVRHLVADLLLHPAGSPTATR